jgi:hypothetical protein
VPGREASIPSRPPILLATEARAVTEHQILEELRAIRRLLERIAGPEPGTVEAEDAAFRKASDEIRKRDARSEAALLRIAQTHRVWANALGGPQTNPPRGVR